MLKEKDTPCLNQVSPLHFSNKETKFPFWIYIFIDLIAFSHHRKLSFILENCFQMSQSSETET